MSSVFFQLADEKITNSFDKMLIAKQLKPERARDPLYNIAKFAA